MSKFKQRGHIDAEYGPPGKRGRLVYMLIGNLIGFIGFGIMIATLGWLPSIGIFLLMWANNIILSAQKAKP